eukprot:13864802-Ditylum_brightwellii.AAC.1
MGKLAMLSMWGKARDQTNLQSNSMCMFPPEAQAFRIMGNLLLLSGFFMKAWALRYNRKQPMTPIAKDF